MSFEEINGIQVPAGVYLLEPRDMYDPTLIGVAKGDGRWLAVYSRDLIIEALAEEAMEDGDDDPYITAIEHFDFNVAGSFFDGSPVFR